MIFDEISHIGTHHIQHNEDQILKIEITSNQSLMAVMDGCSMGDESHFASSLIKKSLQTIAKHFSYRSFIELQSISNKDLIEHVLHALHKKLNEIKNLLILDTNDLLSTLLLVIIDHKTRRAEAVCIGDGLIQYDNNIIEWNQDNKPDYLAYHLTRNSDDWLQSIHQRVTIDNFQKLSICTDGIFTFRNEAYQLCDEQEMIAQLLTTKLSFDPANNLHKTLLKLRRSNINHTDDLSIISVYHE